MGAFLSSLGTAAAGMGKDFAKDLKGNPLKKEQAQDTPSENYDVSHPQSQLQWQPLGQALPSYDKGGDVPANQTAELSQGERVLNPEEAHAYKSAAIGNAPETPLGRIAARAHELHDQGTPLGNSMPSYDDGGNVPDDQTAQVHEDEHVLDPKKAADYRQAESEVMNNAPLGHGQPQERQAAQNTGMKRFPQPSNGPARLQYDTEKPVQEEVSQPVGAQMNTDNAPLGKTPMYTKNAPVYANNPAVQDASTSQKPSAGIKGPMASIETPLHSGAEVTDPETVASTPDKPQESQQQLNGAAQEQMNRVGGPDTRDLPAVSPEHRATPPSPEKQTVMNDQTEAMKSGDLVKLGMSNINMRTLEGRDKDKPENVQPALPAPTAPSAEENLENQRTDLKHKMLNAPTEQERFQAEKDLAELNRRSPWGSEGNHPGTLGKIGHVLGRVGQAALSATAPYANAAIPGSQEGLAAQEARGEAGVEAAQKKQQQTAVTKEAEQQPALREEQQTVREGAQKLAAQKVENTLNMAGYRTNPLTGEHVPLKYEEMSPQQQAKADKDESIQTLNEAKGHEQEAKAILERYKADPSSPQNQAALGRLQEEAKRTSIAAGKLGLDQKRFMADYYGLGEDGQPIPGVEMTPEGKPVGPKISKAEQATTSMRLNKADLSQNVQLNASNASKLIDEHPDLFGKVSGRFTNAAQMTGTNDPAIVQLGIQVHNMAVASAGIHGQRGQAAVEAYEKDILNKFHNSPEATKVALNELSGSVQTFIDDAKAGKKVAPTPKTSEEVKTGIPKTATHTYKDKTGKVVGYADGGKYHALE